MLAELLVPLRDEWILFNLFRYITFRSFLAAALAFVLVVLLMPLYIRHSARLGFREVISEELPEHRDKAGTPTVGGIVFVSVALGVGVLLARPDVPWTWLALLVPAYMALLGFWDDLRKVRVHKRGIPKRWKLLLQGVLALAVWRFVLLHVPGVPPDVTQVLFFKNFLLHLGVLFPVFAFFVLVGSVNAVNLTDGLDGLAGGVVLPPLAVMSVVAYVAGHRALAEYLNVLYIPHAGEAAVVGAAFAGAVLGFLWYNVHPAEVFMGDTGSQALGGVVGTLAIIAKQEILLAVAGGMLVVETLSVALQIFTFRFLGGRRVFRRAPLHHHFELLGWPESKIVARFWFLSVICAVLALATLKVR